MLLQSANGQREVRLADWLRSNPRNYSGLEVFHRQDAEEDDDDIKKLKKKGILSSDSYLQEFRMNFMFYWLEAKFSRLISIDFLTNLQAR